MYVCVLLMHQRTDCFIRYIGRVLFPVYDDDKITCPGFLHIQGALIHHTFHKVKAYKQESGTRTGTPDATVLLICGFYSALMAITCFRVMKDHVILIQFEIIEESFCICGLCLFHLYVGEDVWHFQSLSHRAIINESLLKSDFYKQSLFS